MILGIDPGVNGAAAAICGGCFFTVCRFGRASDLEIFHFLKTLPCRCAIPHMFIFMEQVGARRGDFGPQLATFMRQAGLIDGMIVGTERFGTPSYVEPKTWQREFNLGGKHGRLGCTDAQEYSARKKAHLTKAHELFLLDVPFKITTDLADAMLIAEYGRRLDAGELTHGKDDKPKRKGEGIRWQRS